MHVDLIKELRNKTGAGVMDCRRALLESKGDFDKAVCILKEKGMEIAQKKSSRDVKEGLIESYIHLGGKLGVLLEVNCETDFVARNENFKKLCKDIAMQIAAANPLYINSEDIPAEILEKEKNTFTDSLRSKSKENIEKNWETHLTKFKKASCLMEQSFIRDEKITIKDYVNSIIAQFGENIRIKRFMRYQLGG
jgi:elongation factor Ts